MSILDALFANNDPRARLAERNFAYFSQQQNPNQSALAQLPQEMPQQPQQSALAQIPESQVPEPYNLAERIFLGAGGQGAAVKADKQRYALGRLIEKLPAPSDPTAAALRNAAIQDPENFGKTYLEKYAMPNYVTKDIDGKLVRFNANDPSSAPEVIYGGSGAEPEEEMKLRKEFGALSTVKDFRTIHDAYKKIESVGNAEPTAANDMAMIFSIMKLYDPNSVVRETEYATAENARGVPDSLRARYNKIVDGERLSDNQREEFLQTANTLYGAQIGNYNQAVDQYRTLASQYKFDPDRIAKPATFTPYIPKGVRAPSRGKTVKTIKFSDWK